MNRGSSFALAGRTRKGLTLLWVALFVFSLLLQSVVLAAPTPALAASGLLADTVAGIRDRRRSRREQREHQPRRRSRPASLIDNPPMTDGEDWLDPQRRGQRCAAPSTPTTFLFQDATDPGDISAYAGGNKEDDTRDWDYVNSAGPNPKTDFKHIMAHAEGRRGQRVRLPGRRAHRQQRDDGRRLRAEQEAVQGLPGRWAAQARPHRRRPADLARVLERRRQPDRDPLRDRQRPELPERPDRRLRQGQRRDDAQRRPQRDQLRRPREFGLRLHHPDLRLRRGVHRPLEARHRDRLPRLLAAATSAAAPAATPPARSSRTRLGRSRSTSTTAARSRSSRWLTRRAGRTSTTRPPAGTACRTSASRTTATTATRWPTPRTSTTVVPGTYTVTEAAKAGWKLTDLDCDDGNSTVNVDTGVATIKVGNNEHVTCTYTNTKLGKIIVEKQTEPDGSAGSFVFTGDAAGSIGDGGQIVVDDLLPGTYTSTENNPAPPFDLGSIICDDANSDGQTSRLAPPPSVSLPARPSSARSSTSSVARSRSSRTRSPTTPRTSASRPRVRACRASASMTMTTAPCCAPRRSPTSSPARYSVTESAVTSWELTGLTCTRHQRLDRRQERLDRQHRPQAGWLGHLHVHQRQGRPHPGRQGHEPVRRPGELRVRPELRRQLHPDGRGRLRTTPATSSPAPTRSPSWPRPVGTCPSATCVPTAARSRRSASQAGETVTCTFTNIKRGHIIIDKVTVPGW